MKTLNITEEELLQSVVKGLKDKIYLIVNTELGEFEKEGEKQGYARLLVCEKAEYEALESIGLTERAEIVKFPITKYDGSDISGVVGKVVKTSNLDNWIFRKSNKDVGYRRQERQIVGLTYKLSMEEVAQL
ncbi:Uncharacterised protein [Streptococcus pneumoniae]|nr:Uncharacterised protein [Streptococcus pneumoniae]VLY11640.1 Uncharacterised protein [Streptococcus pneumoniae]VRS33000.1 Uncharacterised protein [Streptococcus pneumoniae]VRS41406.1 Uncharacterised protein [Streptococcus pneumoniae]HET2847709.1 hypothetical protein [Streptococcus pneumoniae]